MKRDLIVYTVLLVLGLGGAYYSSLPKNDSNADQIEWFKVDPKAVTKITYVAPKGVAVEADRIQGTDSFWIKVKNQDQSDPQKAAGDEFKAASKAMNDVLASFDPLYVLRVIGEPDKKNEDEFGLKDSQTMFKLEGGSRSLELKIGKKVFGGSNIYAFDTKQNKILLLKGTPIENVANAGMRLFERDITDASLDDVSMAEVRHGDKTKKLEHVKKDAQGELQWSGEGEKGEVKPAYGSWINKVTKLRIEKFAGKDDEDALAKLEDFLVVKLKKNDLVRDELEFKKMVAADEKPSYWVKSKFLQGHFAKTNAARMDSVEKDMTTIFE